MKKINRLAFLILLLSSSLFANTNDCDGDCTKKNFENKVLPNRKPAVVLQEEIESITKVNRSPAVVNEDQDQDVNPKEEKGAHTPVVRQHGKIQK